jgi:hypothetical protein
MSEPEKITRSPSTAKRKLGDLARRMSLTRRRPVTSATTTLLALSRIRIDSIDFAYSVHPAAKSAITAPKLI